MNNAVIWYCHPWKKCNCVFKAPNESSSSYNCITDLSKIILSDIRKLWRHKCFENVTEYLDISVEANINLKMQAQHHKIFPLYLSTMILLLLFKYSSFLRIIITFDDNYYFYNYLVHFSFLTLTQVGKKTTKIMQVMSRIYATMVWGPNLYTCKLICRIFVKFSTKIVQNQKSLYTLCTPFSF